MYDRTQTSERRRTLAERYQYLVENIKDFAVCMLTPNGMVDSWNAGAELLLGYAPEDILGKPFSIFYPEEDRAVASTERALHVAAIEAKFEHEGWQIRENGSRLWAHVVIEPIRDDEGELIGFASITRDITEKRDAALALDNARKAAQVKTAAYEDLVRLFDQAPGFVCFFRGPEHVYSLANEAHAQLAQHKDIMGKPVRVALPELEGQGFFELLDNVYQSGEPFLGRSWPLSVERAPGVPAELRYIDFIYQPIFDDEHKVVGIFAQGSDVTDRVHAEEEINRQQQALENLIEERTRALEKAEAALEQAQRLQGDKTHLLTLFDQAPGFVCVLMTENHVFELANKAYFQLVGHRELIGKSVREALPEIEGQGFFELLDEVLKSGKPFIGEAVPVTLQDHPQALQRIRYLDFIYQPIIDANGKIIGIFCQGNDVTEKQLVQEALRLSEERLKEGLVAAKMATWDWDLQKGEVEFSNNAADIFGADQASLRKPWSLLHPDDAELLSSARDRALVDKEPYAVVVRVIRPDTRETSWIEIRGQVRCDKDGRAHALSGIALDLTSHKQAEENIKEGERLRRVAEAKATEADEKLALAVDAAELGTFYCPMPLGKIYWNATCKRHFFLPEDAEIDFDLFYSRLHPDDRERTRRAVEAAVYNRQGYDIEYRTVAPDGRTRWVRAKGRSYYGPDGMPTRFDGITIDISRQKQAEEELTRASRQKDDFLAMLAHELRNPLAPISSAASLLMLANTDQTRISRTSEIIGRQVKHMSGLLDDLLDVSRVTRGMVELKKQVIDIKQIISAAAEQVNPLMESRRHQLTVQLPAQAIYVFGDEKRLIQVIANLLINSAKYTPQNGHVEVNLEANDKSVFVSVTDNGIGMAPELVSRVFELFVQGERSPDRQQGGLGLGLALVKSLVELHGGQAKAHSAGVGRGSVFTVVLPRHYLAERRDGSSGDHQAFARSNKPLKVMVVDDNIDAANTMAMFLEAIGHEVSTENDSRAALAVSAERRPDVFMLDLGMPAMDGYELARRLREQPQTQKAILIAVSGYGQDQDKKQAVAAGFDHHMVKPVDMMQLAALFQTL